MDPSMYLAPSALPVGGEADSLGTLVGLLLLLLLPGLAALAISTLADNRDDGRSPPSEAAHAPVEDAPVRSFLDPSQPRLRDPRLSVLASDAAGRVLAFVRAAKEAARQGVSSAEGGLGSSVTASMDAALHEASSVWVEAQVEMRVVDEIRDVIRKFHDLADHGGRRPA